MVGRDLGWPAGRCTSEKRRGGSGWWARKVELAYLLLEMVSHLFEKEIELKFELSLQI
jgi:hypothetical protein